MSDIEPTNATPAASANIDPRFFRTVLGAYPTGVCVVTASSGANSTDAERLALLVGSFTSISLDPMLVGFFPGKTSSTWPRIAATGRFCINVLAADQIELCTRFTARDGERFAGLEHDLSPAGLPLLRGTAAWIDCRIAEVIEVGDHFLVTGAVEALGADEAKAPLLFWRGGYQTLAATV